MKIKRRIVNILSIFLFSILLFSLIKLYKGYNEIEYSGNPLFPGWYADPEIALLDSLYWIFPTYSSAFEDQVFLDAFSSPDLINWTKHDRIIDTALIHWADSAMWAPCLVQKNEKYYLFFAANDLQTPESKWYNPSVHPSNMIGGIGIAQAFDPGGPYTDFLGEPLIGKVLKGAQPIDQFVFEEKGHYYIIYGGWGHCNLALLNDDFTNLIPFKSGDLVKEITPDGYVEGPVLFKKDDSYYLMWSEGGWTNQSYRVAYGTSDSLTGPFERRGTVLQMDPKIAGGAGHHSVFNIPCTDEWYIVYHRRPIPNKGRDHRVTCIDRMYFDDKGNILPVKMTFQGVEKRLLRSKRKTP